MPDWLSARRPAPLWLCCCTCWGPEHRPCSHCSASACPHILPTVPLCHLLIQQTSSASYAWSGKVVVCNIRSFSCRNITEEWTSDVICPGFAFSVVFRYGKMTYIFLLPCECSVETGWMLQPAHFCNKCMKKYLHMLMVEMKLILK